MILKYIDNIFDTRNIREQKSCTQLLNVQHCCLKHCVSPATYNIYQPISKIGLKNISKKMIYLVDKYIFFCIVPKNNKTNNYQYYCYDYNLVLKTNKFNRPQKNNKSSIFQLYQLPDNVMDYHRLSLFGYALG